jgi:RNA polymerase sigma factor (sigma-70 family)
VPGDLSSSALFLQAELGRAWQEHRPRLLRMLERRIGPDQRSRFDPDDVLSEAFLVALRRWPEFCRTRPVGEYAWLYRITWDALIEAWRREHRQGRDQGRDVPFPDRSSIQLGLKIVNPGTKPEDAFARQELSEQVRQALEALPEQQREILSMHRLDEMPVTEITEILGLDQRTVYREIRRAVEQVARILRTFNCEGERP